jgi:phospholipase/carboxylesterase
VSCDVALCSTRALAGLILMSGTLLAQERWQAGAPGRADLRILQSHGRQDALLPFDAATRLRDLLRAAGCDVPWIEFNGGHEIPAGVLAGVGELIRACT